MRKRRKNVEKRKGRGKGERMRKKGKNVEKREE